MAHRKLAAAGVVAKLQHGYLRDAQTLLALSGVNKIVSSLVFHQVPAEEKRVGLCRCRRNFRYCYSRRIDFAVSRIQVTCICEVI